MLQEPSKRILMTACASQQVKPSYLVLSISGPSQGGLLLHPLTPSGDPLG